MQLGRIGVKVREESKAIGEGIYPTPLFLGVSWRYGLADQWERIRPVGTPSGVCPRCEDSLMRHPPRLSALLSGVALTMASTAFALMGTASGAAAAPACTVEYSVVGQWAGGYQGAVTVTNNSASLNGWSLGFAFPAGQVVSQGWGGKWSQSGTNVTVVNESWNAALGTGAKISGGFIASWSGANTAPTAFTLNGTPCNTDVPPTPTPTPTDPTTPPWMVVGMMSLLLWPQLT